MMLPGLTDARVQLYTRSMQELQNVLRPKSRLRIFLVILLVLMPAPVFSQEAGVLPGPGTVMAAGSTILDGDHRVSRSGELRYFQAYSSHGGRMMLKVFRLEGERLVLVGTSPLVTLPPAETATFSCRIPVSRGDLIGCYCPDTNCVDRMETGVAMVADGDAGGSPSSAFREETGVPAVFAAGSQVFDSPSQASTNLVLPVVARTRGAEGTRWQSSLELLNTSESETQVALYFNVSGVDNTRPAASAQIRLPARSGRSIDDILLDLFQIEEATGSLDIVASAPLFARARIFNVDEVGGSFGQSVPAIPVSWALGEDVLSGLNPHASTSVVFGLIENEHFRTNLGIANVSGAPLEVLIRAYEGTNLPADPVTVGIPAYSHRQLNRILDVFGLSSEGHEIRLELTVLEGNAGRFLAYTSRVDNLTGDAVFSVAVHEAPLDSPSKSAKCGLCRIP